MRMLYQSRVGTRVANQRLNHVFIEGTSMHFTIERNRAIAVFLSKYVSNNNASGTRNNRHSTCDIYEELVYGLMGSDILFNQSLY